MPWTNEKEKHNLSFLLINCKIKNVYKNTLLPLRVTVLNYNALYHVHHVYVLGLFVIVGNFAVLLTYVPKNIIEYIWYIQAAMEKNLMVIYTVQSINKYTLFEN